MSEGAIQNNFHAFPPVYVNCLLVLVRRFHYGLNNNDDRYDNAGQCVKFNSW